MKQQTTRLLINSLPKSGTHLLTKAVEILNYKPHFNFQDVDGKRVVPEHPRAFFYGDAKTIVERGIENDAPRDQQVGMGMTSTYYVNQDTFSHWLTKVKAGHYIIGHMPWTANIKPILNDSDFKIFMIIRDPRAVIASLIPFILNARVTHHLLEKDFEPLTPMQRLNLLLEGGYAEQAGVQIEDYATIYREAWAWNQQDNCLFMKFEDLVGVQGGGDSDSQQQIMNSIAQHLDIEVTDEIADKFSAVYDVNSPTFRKGQIDGWKTRLDEECIERLDDYCKPLCELAGYAQ